MLRVFAARSKPIPVDAVRYTDPTDVADTLRWLNERRGVGWGFYDHRTVLWVDTPTGRITARLGDWLVALPQKQFKVLSSTDFDQQYDLVGVDE